jgi:hypothetical protein
LPHNGDGYEAGLEQAFWKLVQDDWKAQNSETEAGVRQALTLQAIRWQHLHGLPDPDSVSPGTVDSRHSLTESHIHNAVGDISPVSSEGHCYDRVTA